MVIKTTNIFIQLLIWLSGQPIPVFLPGEFHGQRRTVVYCLWDNKELDTTEWLTLTLQFIHSVMSNYLQHCGLQLTRLPCPSPTPGDCKNWCPLSWWCHPTIWSSVIPFSSSLQCFPSTRIFPMSQSFTSVGQSTGLSASASELPMTIQDGFPLRLTSWIFLQSKELSRVFSNATVQKHQFFNTQVFFFFFKSNFHIYTWLLEIP